MTRVATSEHLINSQEQPLTIAAVQQGEEGRGGGELEKGQNGCRNRKRQCLRSLRESAFAGHSCVAFP